MYIDVNFSAKSETSGDRSITYFDDRQQTVISNLKKEINDVKFSIIEKLSIPTTSIGFE